MSDLYPPILPSYIPAFKYDADSVRIYFALSHYNKIEEVASIQFTLRFQRNNISALKTNSTTDSISVDIGQERFHTVINPNETSFPYYIEINSGNIKKILSNLNDTSGFSAGTYYKLQIRLCGNKWTNTSVFNPGISDLNTYSKYFSEWSSVCVLKAIEIPTVLIKEFDKGVENNSNSSTKIEYTTTAGDAEFYGIYKKSSNSDEIPYTWRMKISQLDKNTDEYVLKGDSGDVVFNSYDYTGILNSSETTDEIPFKYNFKFQLEEDNRYKLEVKVVTKNGYECIKDPYEFDVSSAITANVTPTVVATIDNENAYVKLHISNENTVGTYMLTVRRTSSESNFEYWEDITNINIKNEAINVFFYDYAVESGIIYKYGVQTRDNNYRRSAIIKDSISESVMGDFQYAYLLGSCSGLKNDAIQLKLMYDVSISSFGTTVMESKMDTIGSKYPFITRNGDIYYRTFPITGLISYHMNETETESLYFMNLETDSEKREYPKTQYIEYDDKEVALYNTRYTTNTQEQEFLSRSKVYGESKTEVDNINGAKSELFKPILKDNPSYWSVQDNSDMYYDSMYDFNYERAFREKVMKFLYDGKPKLFKSASEGNILVKLMEVSFTPKQELGRMIYEFSATAYEIDEPTLDNLNNYGIQKIKPYEKSLADIKTYLGQLSSWDITFTGGFRVNQYIQDKHHINFNEGWNGMSYTEGYITYLKITFESPPYLIFKQSDGTLTPAQGTITDPTKGVMGWLFNYNGKNILVTYPNYIYEFKGSNVKIPIGTNISFPKAIDGTIDYLVQVTQQPASSTKIIRTTEFNEYIGQIYKILQPYSDFISDIRGKYEKYTDDYEQTINSFLSIDVEADPGTVFYLQTRRDTEPRRYVINFTGNLVIDPDMSNIIYSRGYFTGININETELQKHTDYGTVTDFPENIKEMDYCTKDNQTYIYYKRNWRYLNQVETTNTYDIECPIEGIVNYYIQTVKGYY